MANNGTLSAGSFCEVYLTGAGREGVISVPVSALSEQQGKYFVYVQVHDDAYDKRPVQLGADAGDRVEILAGLEPGEKVVPRLPERCLKDTATTIDMITCKSIEGC